MVNSLFQAPAISASCSQIFFRVCYAGVCTEIMQHHSEQNDI